MGLFGFGGRRQRRTKAARPSHFHHCTRALGQTSDKRAPRFEVLEERRLLSSNQASVSEQASLTGTSFVNALYQELLNRPADAGGLSFYNNLLAQGATPATIVNDIWQSPEHRGIEVDNFYVSILGRNSGPAGRQTWINAFMHGASESAVSLGFLDSAEFVHNNPLNSSFVSGLYQVVLHRSPDDAGATNWVNGLNNHSLAPAQVAQAFVNSHESHVDIVDSFYSNYLGRPADPGGEASWAAALDNGATAQNVAVGILASAEFITLHPI